ncbi:Rid family detoxifying hydrolase [Desulforhopalus singaporensis]|uniref:Endoribonuclease L-PSP n=1 Tax=Desulforhopalus singaporensis TaxID=91360 RepID=A0A1H0QYC8_9BACT|nr:Rid family detoxifying hydrolase [Desulforhopalus singaporensis]SDP21889.1 endoribonuclease L-PSP [Desulforhopalus singaporensis]
MSRTVIATAKAPAAVGPYSQGIAENGFLFISGQLPLNPETGRLLEADIGKKTKLILSNAAAIAAKAGTDLSKVVKATIYLTDLEDFQAVNSAYAKFFPDEPPARSTVQVAALPLESDIEIDFIVAL